MTQTVRRVPGQRTARRLSFVYAYDTLRVDEHGMVANTGIEVGYVGKTVQRLSARDDQHRGIAGGPDGTPAKCQPFSDLIVGGIRIVEQGMWTEAELDERERFHIERLKPRYNHEHNGGNPLRVPIYVARQQRDARDAARGVTPQTWAPPRAPARRRLVAKRVMCSPWTWWLAGWLAAVVGVLVAVSWAADKSGQDLTLLVRAWTAAIVATAGVGWLWWRWSGRRRWRRFWRRR